MAGVSAAQVRRDIMNLGCLGNTINGYNVAELAVSISHSLDDPTGQLVALVGVGDLGRAILKFFPGRRPKLSIVAAFDNDPRKFGRVIQGCRVYNISDLSSVVAELGITIGTITVPAEEAQNVADILVREGINGILNFAPTNIRVPPNVYVEDINMTISLEKVAYFARKKEKTVRKSTSDKMQSLIAVNSMSP